MTLPLTRLPRGDASHNASPPGFPRLPWWRGRAESWRQRGRRCQERIREGSARATTPAGAAVLLAVSALFACAVAGYVNSPSPARWFTLTCEPIAGLPPVHTVVMDDYAGGYQATSYLAALGHRKIAFVSGPAELGSVQERYRGYLDALAKAGIDASGQVCLDGQFTEQFGMSALPHLIAPADPPTAAFVASDYIALGVLSAAETHGIRVPEDLSVVGFDDIRFSQYVRPRLTTVRSPFDRLAQVGVELLFERLADRDAPARTEVLPVELVVRESAGPPPAGR